MKQIIVIAVCILMVMLVGYAVQKENLVFGPMAVATDYLPPEPKSAVETSLPVPPEPALVPSPFAFSFQNQPQEANVEPPHLDDR
ncbi:hypothetical protein AGMMS49944_32140 [Spirochaetia bacterium]|nr:hypothetical protein AGMMS49944_32140 [Spirochaetia bacterium]